MKTKHHMNNIQDQSRHGGKRPGAGRKKGSGQASTYRAMLEPHAKRLIQKVVDMADEGDMTALKHCLDRLCAPLRATDRLITIDGFITAKELSDKGELVLRHVVQGIITPAEGSSIMNAITSQARILEIDEIERRITELEKIS